jgi:hypothetical protein
MKQALVSILLLAVAFPSSAIRVEGTRPPGKNAAPPAIKPDAARAMSDDSAGLRRGPLEAVSIEKGTFNMYGQTLTFAPNRVKVFGKDGKQQSIHNLKRGGNVRFTMDPTDPAHRRVAVIYTD